MAGKGQGLQRLEQRFWILRVRESQWEVLRKGEKWLNVWFYLHIYVFIWLLCEMCIIKGVRMKAMGLTRSPLEYSRRHIYGFTRIGFVEMERNGQIWDVLEFGQ